MAKYHPSSGYFVTSQVTSEKKKIAKVEEHILSVGRQYPAAFTGYLG